MKRLGEAAAWTETPEAERTEVSESNPVTKLHAKFTGILRLRSG
jgi:hypothetical protein